MLWKDSALAIKPKRRREVLRGLIVFVFTVFSSAFLFSFNAFAQTQAAQNIQAVAAQTGVSGAGDFYQLLGRIINIVLGFIGVILLAFLIYAGFLWMTANGDPKAVDKAKSVLKNAAIGLVILIASFAIANYVLGLFGNVNGEGGVTGSAPGTGGFPSAAGSLGGGIIEYHAPPRDATDVPRNTAIVITFKEPIKIASFIKDYNDNGTPANLADDPTSSTTIGLNSDAIKIYPTGHPDQALTTAAVRVRFTYDRKTFVMKPVNYLGSPTQKTGYTVELLPGKTGILREDGSPAFSGAFSSGYKWQFEVSTVIDTTPPHITSVIPSMGGRYAPNIVVQVNFSEMIDPTSASGIFSQGAGFTNLQVVSLPIDADPAAKANPVDGEFKISNQYSTVEFVSNLPCGVNSCGKKIYCLPSDSAITAMVKAATLSSQPPAAELTGSGYDGVTDLAGNSLDGNGNGKAEGPDTDNYVWGFGTESKPNLTPPHVQSTKPAAGDAQASSFVPLSEAPRADFDSVLQASTITSDSAYIRTNEASNLTDTFWWTPAQILLNADGTIASGTDAIVSGRLKIDHRIYLPAAPKQTPPEYDPFLLSDLQNVYQNCFNPAASTVCRGPNCCDEHESNSACPFPAP
ncbi:MAG TPA: pilin [Patescibacteria group bacterium]|nr:pilin [Patescibacteria group bacterium]